MTVICHVRNFFRRIKGVRPDPRTGACLTLCLLLFFGLNRSRASPNVPGDLGEPVQPAVAPHAGVPGVDTLRAGSDTRRTADDSLRTAGNTLYLAGDTLRAGFEWGPLWPDTLGHRLSPPDTTLRLPDDFDPRRDIEWFLDAEDPEGSGQRVNALEELSARPVNVNRATADELMEVPGITGQQAEAIVARRRQARPFESVEQITEVRGIGPATLERAAPFLTVGTSSELRRDYYLNPDAWFHGGRTEVLSRVRAPLDRAEGYRRPDSLGGYTGGPVSHYHRLHYRSDHVSAALIRNKRSGERPGGFRGPESGPLHLALHDLGRLRTLVAGDYRVQFGQGLILGGGTTFGKGQEVIRSVNRGGSGVRPHTSTLSSHSFRGLAATWGREWQVTAFASSRPRTASEVSADSIRFPVQSPTFRTRFEADRRNNTRQRTAGARLTRHSEGGRLGIGGLYNRFDRPVRRGSGEWQSYDMQGRSTWALSVDGRRTAGSLQLFGEAGRTAGRGNGIIAGAELAASEQTRLTLSWRHYGRRFQAVFGDSFAEQSGTPRNEQGWYLGLSHRFSPRVHVSGYLDQFTFPGPRFLTRAPSHGFDWMASATVRPDRESRVRFRLRRKVRGEEFVHAFDSGREIRMLAPDSRLTARLEGSRWVQPDLRLRVRLEHVSARPAAASGSSTSGSGSSATASGEDTSPRRPPLSTGWMGWGELRVRPHERLQVDLRLTLFSSDDHHSRLYHFETDMLYAFTSTQLQGRGQRFYLLAGWQPSDRLRIWLRGSATLFRDRDELGSGNERIPGNRRSDAGIQLRYLF